MKLVPFQSSFVDSWVVFQPPAKIMKALLKGGDFERPEANGALGFVYIDHEAGLSLSIFWTAAIQKKTFQLLDLVMKENGSLLLFRYEMFHEMQFYRLDADEMNQLNLPAYPDLYKYYLPNTAVQWIRQEPRFDPFRAPGFPDDLRFTIFQKGLMPEDVWGRCEGISSEGAYVLRLLNQPHQHFGVDMGQLLKVKLANTGEDEPLLLWMPEFGTLQELEDIALQFSMPDPQGDGVWGWMVENKNQQELLSCIHTRSNGQSFLVTGKERLEVTDLPEED